FVRAKISLSGMLTRVPLAVNRKACPTRPFVYAIPKGVVPLFVPALSLTLVSPFHQPTRPDGAETQELWPRAVSGTASLKAKRRLNNHGTRVANRTQIFKVILQ